MLVCKGAVCLTASMVQLGHGEGDGEKRPRGTSSQLMWGCGHCEDQKLRPSSKGSRKSLEDFKQEKLLPYVFWKCLLWLQHDEMIVAWTWVEAVEVERRTN